MESAFHGEDKGLLKQQQKQQGYKDEDDKPGKCS